MDAAKSGINSLSDVQRHFHWIPAGLLIGAAFLKSHQLSTSPYVENLAFQSKSFTTLLIVFEILLALVLVFQFRPKLARLVAMVTFLGFLVFSLGKWIAGESSCGCFGIFEVPPLITSLLDVGVICLLWKWLPSEESRGFPKLLPAIAVLLCGVAIYPVLTFKTSELSDVGEVIGDGEMVILETENWVGKHLPIASLISGEKQFMKGQWRMILYHDDCPVCQKLIRNSESGGDELPTVYVEVPPHNAVPRQNRPDLLWRKLTNKHEWFVAAPNALSIQDGIVKTVEGQLH